MPGLFILPALFGDDVFEKAPHWAWREEPLKQSPPGSVFCLRNNFFVGRLAVFSIGGVWSRWIHFSRARCLGASLLSAAEPGVAAGTKTAADGYERKALVGIGEQERAEGRYYPSQNKPNRGNYPGHTLHRRGNIELDVTVARAAHYVLVRGFEHAYVAFMSVPLFLLSFLLRRRYIVVGGHRFLSG